MRPRYAPIGLLHKRSRPHHSGERKMKADGILAAQARRYLGFAVARGDT
jgi:hypothetical protein